MFRSATDYAFMYPMVEMSNNKFKIIYERLIAYNLHDNNIVKKSKVDESQNRIWCQEIKNKQKGKNSNCFYVSYPPPGHTHNYNKDFSYNFSR